MIIQRIKPILKKDPLAKVGSLLVSLFILLALYAPILASSAPFFTLKESLYFPWLQTLFSKSSYPSGLDRIFNGLMFLLPLALCIKPLRKKMPFIARTFFLFLLCSLFLSFFSPKTRLIPQFQKQCDKIIQLSALIPHQPEKMSWTSHQDSSYLSLSRRGGQNLWASLLFGMRYSLTLSLSASLFAFLVGILWGMVSGFFGGVIDQILSRLYEIWDSMPTLLLVLVLMQFSSNSGFLFKASLLALLSWTSVARLVRLDLLRTKSLPYIDVLRSLERSKFEICLKHLFPSCFSHLLVLFPFLFVGTMMYESALSFLGLGDLSIPSLGRLIDEARLSYPMDAKLFWPPAIVLLSFLVGLVFLGDTLKNALNEK